MVHLNVRHSPGNKFQVVPTRLGKTLKVLATVVLLLFFSSPAFPYSTYDGCKNCHGGFLEDNYISKSDGASWNQSLMDGHETFVGDECDACHKSGGRGEVYLNFSRDATLSKSCVGCHGRLEDVNNSCVGGSGTQVECGGGAGLRRMHDSKVGSGTCSSCHSGDPVPVGEHVQPFNYDKSGVQIRNACDDDGTESAFGANGLDNDGDEQIDGSDSDCQSNTAPTQPGTLSASAITINSATVSWGASTDVDGDTINYLVEYRRNGDTPWTSAGSTTSTSQPLAGLDSGQAYDVQVTPDDGVDTGTARTTPNLFETVFVNTPPTQPGTLSATSVTSTTATVIWGASTDVDDDAISYLVEYRRNGDQVWSDCLLYTSDAADDSVYV